jgi:hypothetical protein
MLADGANQVIPLKASELGQLRMIAIDSCCESDGISTACE